MLFNLSTGDSRVEQRKVIVGKGSEATSILVLLKRSLLQIITWLQRAKYEQTDNSASFEGLFLRHLAAKNSETISAIFDERAATTSIVQCSDSQSASLLLKHYMSQNTPWRSLPYDLQDKFWAQNKVPSKQDLQLSQGDYERQRNASLLEFNTNTWVAIISTTIAAISLVYQVSVNDERGFEWLFDSAKALIQNNTSSITPFSSLLLFPLISFALWNYYKRKKQAKINRIVETVVSGSEVKSVKSADWSSRDESVLNKRMYLYFLGEKICRRRNSPLRRLHKSRLCLVLNDLSYMDYRTLLHFHPSLASMKTVLSTQENVTSEFASYYNGISSSVDKYTLTILDQTSATEILEELDIDRGVAVALASLAYGDRQDLKEIFTKICNGQVEPTIANLQAFINPAKVWQKNISLAIDQKDSDGLFLFTIEYVLANIGSCKISVLKQFFNINQSITVPVDWEKSVEQRCPTVKINLEKQKVRSLSFTRKFFLDLEEELLFPEYNLREILSHLKLYIFESEWGNLGPNKNDYVPEYDIASLVDVFRPNLKKTKNTSQLSTEFYNSFSKSHSFNDFMKYITQEEYEKVIRNLLLSGYKESCLAVLCGIHKFYDINIKRLSGLDKTELNLGNYSRWLLLKAQALLLVGKGWGNESIECCALALKYRHGIDNQGNPREGNEQSSLFYQQLLLSASSIEISSDRDQRVLMLKLRVLTDESLANIRQMIARTDSSYSDKKALIDLHTNFSLIAYRLGFAYPPSTDRSEQKTLIISEAVSYYADEKFDFLEIDYDDLNSALSRIEACARHSIQMLNTDKKASGIYAEKVIESAEKLCHLHIRSAKAIDLLFLAIRTRIYAAQKYKLETGEYFSEVGYNSPNDLLVKIHSFVSEYRRRRKHIVEHYTFAPEYIFMILDRINDAIKIEREYETGTLDKEIFRAISTILTTQLDQWLRSGKYTPSKVFKLEQIIENIDSQMTGITYHSTEEKPEPKELLADDEEELISTRAYKLQVDIMMQRGTHEASTKPWKEQRALVNSYYYDALLLWADNPKKYTRLISEALSLKISLKNYLYSLKDLDFSYPASGDVSNSVHGIMSYVLSHYIHRDAQRVEKKSFLPCRVIEWGKFGVKCKFKDGCNIYVPRLNISDEVLEDYCSGSLSKRLIRIIKQGEELNCNDFTPTLVQIVAVRHRTQRDDTHAFSELNNIGKLLPTGEIRREFESFTNDCHAIGTTKGETFILHVLQQYFRPYYEKAFKYEFKKNAFILSHRWRLVLFAPTRDSQFLNRSATRSLLMAMTGVTDLHVFEVSVTCSEVAHRLCERYAIANDYTVENNVFTYYLKEGDEEDPNLKFVCNVLEEAFGARIERAQGLQAIPLVQVGIETERV